MLVDKPAGMTSHDVVQRVRRVLGTRAAGHTGTLDPFATGLLVVLVGRATRLARFVEAQAKTYLATARLGIRTDTDDLTGAPVGSAGPETGCSEAQVREALAGFAGQQQQRPPSYSAPVTVTIHRIELVAYPAPELVFRATVSPGTYLRAIARDLGERLGVGAHLTALRREAIGLLRVEDAVPLERLAPPDLLPAREVLRHLPAWELDEPDRRAVSHGRPVAADPAPAGDVALLHGGELVAVARAEAGWLRPSVVLGTP